MKNLEASRITIGNGFWKYYEDLNRSTIVKSVYARFKETGRFDALKCNWREGDPKTPHIFWDSDVVKWMEGAAYILQAAPDPELEALVDEMVDHIAENQRADGYFSSYFLSVCPAKIFTNRDWHELYCLGHLIEAAIAYHKATGKEKLLRCALAYVDCVYRIFVEEQSAAFVTPGHEEIELALLKLYEHLGEEKHLALARFFINQRGSNDKEEKSTQIQSHLPVREVTSAVGHSVRACYLYTAMAMLARVDQDESLYAACMGLFEDITSRKMAITGGVGADHEGEKFSYSYDLPNSDTYNETCAAISLAMFAGAMQENTVDSRFGDVIERVYYNGFLSGVSLDGRKFFYTNPLEIDRKKYDRSTYQPPCQRVEVFECSCCPPNVVRMLASIPRYAYTVNQDSVYCQQFLSSVAKFEVNGRPATLTQVTDYPVSGNIRFTYHGEPITLYIRVPEWCVEYRGETENGYARFSLADGESLSFSLPMAVHFVEANPYVQDNAGRYAVQRGPVVYCLEEIDNGENLRDVTLLEGDPIEVREEDGLPAPVLYLGAERRPTMTGLYSVKRNERVGFTARLIPYFAFANREVSDMIVWVMVR